jgi:hypothetical protein
MEVEHETTKILIISVQHDKIEAEFSRKVKSLNLQGWDSLILWEDERRDSGPFLDDPIFTSYPYLGLEDRCLVSFSFLYSAIALSKPGTQTGQANFGHGEVEESIQQFALRRPVAGISIYSKLERKDRILFLLAAAFFQSIRRCIAVSGTCHLAESLELFGFYPLTIERIIEDIEVLLDVFSFGEYYMGMNEKTMDLLRAFFRDFIIYCGEQEMNSWAYLTYTQYHTMRTIGGSNDIADIVVAVRDAGNAAYVTKIHISLGINYFVLVVGEGHRKTLSNLFINSGYHVNCVSYFPDEEGSTDLLIGKLVDWLPLEISDEWLYYAETHYFNVQKSCHFLNDYDDTAMKILYRALSKLANIRLPIDRNSEPFTIGNPEESNQDNVRMYIIMASGYYRTWEDYKTTSVKEEEWRNRFYHLVPIYFLRIRKDGTSFIK